jgi:hypothetical protein
MIGQKSGAPPNGMAMMIKALIPPEVWEAIAKITSDGSVEKIIKFANEAEQINAKIDALSADVRALKSCTCGGYRGAIAVEYQDTGQPIPALRVAGSGGNANSDFDGSPIEPGETP